MTSQKWKERKAGVARERTLAALWQDLLMVLLNRFLPVISRSVPAPWSMKAGESLWIGLYLSDSIGPFSSIGSPMTFMILPRVPWPQGTLIESLVSTTGCPRTNPSVESRAMVRTLLPPKCWATSRTRRDSVPWTSSALRIGGSSPSNYTSTTAPMTWEIFPVAVADVENAPAHIVNDQSMSKTQLHERELCLWLTLWNELWKHL